jgi:hypothetical protein
MYTVDNYKISVEEIKTLFEERQKDIEERGAKHSVFDYNGKIITLKRATIWHNKGKYVKPESTENFNCSIV